MRERRKGNFIWIIITGLAFLFGTITLQVSRMMEEQNEMVSSLSQVEYLSSSTQRLAKMINANNKDEKVIFYIDEQTTRNLDTSHPDSLSLLENPEIKEIADEVIVTWKALMDLFDLPEEDEEATYDVDAILLASDNHFNSMTNLSLKITEESELLADKIVETQLQSYAVLVLITFFMGHYLIMSTMALKGSSQLAIIASLDTATGLYNRSKCQEILNNTSPATSGQKPAVVVIDLNDLKKINDQQGHRVGDELIITFARILQKASSIYPVKPFLGRYGGDEFVVYLTNVENDDLIDKFMTELSRLTAEFNQTETKKFTVSYACGYAINKDGAEGLSTRQLFDEADEEMYKNKRDMKKKLEESKQTETEGS